METVSRYRWVILALSLLCQVHASSLIHLVPPLAPLVQSELGISKAEVGLLASATNIGAWVVVLLAGFLTDRFGMRWMMSAGLAVTGCLLLLMTATASFVQAVLVMFATGLSRGMMFPSSTKIIFDWFPPRGRATAMGVKQMGAPVAGILVASALPAVGLAVGWRLAIAVPGVLLVAVSLIFLLVYREAPGQGLAAAGRVSLRAAMGELLQNRTLLTLCAMAFCYLIVQMALTTYLVLYFSEVVLPPAIPEASVRLVAAGGYLAILQVGGTLGRLFWGLVSDRLLKGKRMAVLVTVGALTAAQALVMAGLRGDWPIPLLMIFVFLFGSTIVGWNGVFNAMLTETVGRKYIATGLGLAMTLTEGGTMLGPPLFGLVVDLTGSYGTAWRLAGFLAALGALIALSLARREKDR